MRIIISEAGGDEYRTARERQIRTPDNAAQAAKVTADSDTEAFTVLCLDGRNGMRSAEIVTNGLLDACMVHPREVFRAALSRNAAAVVLVHNHPSGHTDPSAEDIRITRQLVEAGKIIDIAVLDHVIIGIGNDGGLKWTSMRESGLVDFSRG